MWEKSSQTCGLQSFVSNHTKVIGGSVTFKAQRISGVVKIANNAYACGYLTAQTDALGHVAKSTIEEMARCPFDKPCESA